MKKPPAIALRRRQVAAFNFLHKVEVLEKLLTDNKLDQYPKRVSVSSFAIWTDPELEVLPISRSVIYDESEEYLTLRQRMEHLLRRVNELRARSGKKANVEIDRTRILKDAKERAESYLNQYSSAMAQLAEAKKEIECLNIKLRRQAVRSAKVTPLRGLPN